ncbi:MULTISPECIES: hypothetical protein [unclassified Microbacterium]|uniref:hypothetical protein n=1 Tax=unclassified Microbacterium TaxID=2609290 RepID=UPI000EAA7F5B|nr:MULTISPECIES: hypothetical protein [unclassified Microbacterium]MBT2485065.1 hypothetical protein [Microbacterium sp. ISL-108]RKN67912.1 hypothetical protein D7252_10125 [Microbacterium sp. CGR2]
MPPATEDGELRALQTKAYGRGGGLTDAEARRLRELQAAAVAPPAVVESAASPPRSPAVVESDLPTASETSDADPSTSPGPGESDRAAHLHTHDSTGSRGNTDSEDSVAPRNPLRRRWMVVAAASALLLVIGVGVGWALFAQRSEGIVLTAEQQQRRLELSEKAGYDESSVRAIGQDDDALVWFATKDGGESTCMVLDVADQSSDVCLESSEVTPMWLSTSVMLAPEENADDAADDGVGPDAAAEVPEATSVSAYLVYATTGEPLAVIDRWTQADAMLQGFSGDERDRAHELFDEGYEAGLSIIGYFYGEPVWLANHATGATFATCLVVDAADDTECGPEQEVLSQGLRVMVEEPAGTIPASWNIEVAYTRGQTPYLTITGGGRQPTFRTEDGDRTELGGEHGDPIEVTIPSEPEER